MATHSEDTVVDMELMQRAIQHLTNRLTELEAWRQEVTQTLSKIAKQGPFSGIGVRIMYLLMMTLMGL